MDKNTAIEVVKKFLSLLKQKNFKVEKAYLFGSYSSDKFQEWSDIDVALIFKKIKNNFLLDTQFAQLSATIDSRLEPHSFSLNEFTKSNPLTKEILNNGIEIKGNI